MNETSTDPWETNYGRAVLAALNVLGKHVYGGTADAGKVARRRAKNRVARRSRRANR